jgi:hypothetical protein
MEWIAALIRAVGSSFPGASSLVQLNSEIESSKVKERLERIEDPISSLHPDVRDVSSKIYQAVKSSNSNALDFDDEFYSSSSRPLAALEAYGAIRGEHALTKRYACGVRITSPTYMLYMAALFESDGNMSKLIHAVDTCEPGKWINGDTLASQLSLPSPLVRSVFEIYRDKGYGLLSGEIGSNRYMAKV